MLKQEENDRLTRVGPGTPMGNLLRRYWQPVGCSQLVTSKPQRVKVLGEDLVLYRGASGKAVLMQLRCAHRGVALDYGRVEGDSIRCPYHGWLFNGAGRCVAQPAEPDADSYKDEVGLVAYPTEEVSGLVFAYMGPAPAPVLPLYDVLRMNQGFKQIRYYNVSSNWLQDAENILDVAHFSWLHGYVMPNFGGKKVDYSFEHTDYGMEIRLGVAGSGAMDITPYIFPAQNRFALPNGEGGLLQALVYRVPTDDYSHQNYFVAFSPSDQVPQGGDHAVQAIRFDTKIGEYLPLADDWWGIDLGDQDRMALEQQGAIYDRTKEHLVGTDVGIVRMRRMLREQMEAVERGEDPIGIIRDPAKQNVMFDVSVASLTQNAREDADYSVGLFSDSQAT